MLSPSPGPAVVFGGMKGHESITLGVRLSWPSPRALEIEWMLYADVLDGCPDRFHWHDGQPPVQDRHIELSFVASLAAQPAAPRSP